MLDIGARFSPHHYGEGMIGGNDTRQRLLEAAITALEEGGESGVRVDEIAAAANITKPSLYHFFGSRDGLIAAAQAERFQRLMMTGLDTALELVRTAPSREAFVALFPAILGIGAGPEGIERRRERAAVLGSAATRPALAAEVQRVLRDAVDQLAEFTTIGTERGLIDTAFDPDAIALWWFSVLAARHLVEVADDERLTAQWEEMTIRSLHEVLLGGR